MERRKVWIGAEPVAWRAGKANGEMGGERLEVELGCVCVCVRVRVCACVCVKLEEGVRRVARGCCKDTLVPGS